MLWDRGQNLDLRFNKRRIVLERFLRRFWAFLVIDPGHVKRGNLAFGDRLLLKVRGDISFVLNWLRFSGSPRPPISDVAPTCERLVRVKLCVHEILVISHF